jgi:TonB family protein
MAHPASLTRYPAEQIFLRHGAAGSFGLHLFVVSVIILIAFLTHVKTIEQLMAEGGSIAQSGPAPEQSIEVLLRPEDLPPPPPTINPEFIRQTELPKPKVVPPPPVPVRPQPKPVRVSKPRYTAPQATGTGESASVSQLVVGSSGFPQPGYPYEARLHHQTGTVSIGIQFDGSGAAADVEVIASSGVSILDSSTRNFIREHWHDDSFAGRHVTVPVEYRL